KAAEKTFVTQPTLSQQVKKLEDQLGAVIFNRSGRRARLTPVGEKIVEHARKVLHEAEMLKSVIGEESKTLHGELRLAVIPTLAPVCLPGLLKEFRRRAPSLN